ncbi:dehydrogenase [Arthrobacter sp. MYb23]|uniref:zinc-binding dehydrogenase n=1 Tax=unclassified Arthrobacter TaxID=235627 RepID=UPI000CFAA008|nr:MULTISPECIES: zinc-binding dehydrogenase [unclassified Arthrobacter]PRB43412.1 dehydrogenase [Arthrobacter sp. MYb51]PRB96930.1 dehydrogenase [Arthrobacter sp. MYb23]
MDTQTLPLTASAQVWTGGSEFRNLRVDLPTLAHGEALATIDLATICGSDIHTISGRRPGPHPGILGHEAVGRITSIGIGGVKDFRGRELQPGDRVIWSVTVSCGQCARCRAGVTAKCVELLKTGHEPLDGVWGLSGGYSSHIHLRRGITMVSVPETVSDAAAAPVACATATVMAVMEAAGVLAGKRVLISGAGMLGIVACAVAQHRGASAVHVRDINPERLALAREFGATDAAAPNEDRPGLAVDIAVDLSGATQAVESAFASLDIKGRMVLAGSVSPGPAVLLDPERMVRSLLTVTGVHNYEPKHLQEAMDFVHETRDTYQWDVLVEEPCALAELPFLMQPPTGRSLRKSVTPNVGTIRRTS